MENAGFQIGGDYSWIGKRLIGHHSHHLDGPLLIVMGAIHGNEPAGVKALRMVFQQLEEWNLVIEGAIIGLVGNLRALSQKKRYLSKDLNRQWTMDTIMNIKQASKYQLLEEEDVEQKELIELLERILPVHKNSRRVVLLDLHTTSASGVAYSIATSTGSSRELAESLGVPVIMNLDKAIEGTTLNYFSEMGLESFCFEAGQHDDEESIKRTVSVIWQMLIEVGCIDMNRVPLLDKHKEKLEEHQLSLQELGRDLPKIMRFKYRHSIQPQDCFQMIEGFNNFQRIEKGQLLAYDRKGEVRADYSGIMLMPLYQAQGKDGFFLAEEV